MSECDLELKKSVNAEEAQGIVSRFEEYKAKNKLDPNDSMTDHLTRMIAEIENRKELSAIRSEHAVTAYQEANKFIFKDSLTKNKTGDTVFNPKKVRKNFRQFMQNIGDKQSVIADQSHQFFTKLVSDKKIVNMMRTPDFQRNIYRAIMHPDRYKFPDGSPVRMMADAIRKYNDWSHVQKIKRGYSLGYAKNYVVKQIHNMEKIVADTKGWKAQLDKSLDWDHMQVPTARREDFLDEVLMKVTRPKETIEGVFVSKDVKTLHFKNADGAFAYQQSFGADNMFDQLNKSLHVDAKNLALAEVMGVQHDMNFKAHMKEIDNRLKEVDASTHQATVNEMNKAYDYLSGKNAWGSPKTTAGKVAVALRQSADMSLLKATSAITTITDFAFGAGTMNSVFGGGVNKYAKTLIQSSIDTMKLFGSTEKQIAWADKLGVFATDLSPMSGMRFAREGVETGMSWKPLDRLHSWSMAATGLPRQAVSARLANTKQFAMGLADNAHLGFDNLYSGTRQLFDELNISSKEWDIIRAHALDDFDGHKIITPEKLRNVLGEDFHEVSGKLASMFRQAAETGSPTGSVRSASFKNAFSPDSVEGMAVRFAMQYKSFPLAAARTMGKMANRGSTQAAVANMAMPAVTATTLGGIVMQLRNYVNKGEFINMEDEGALFWTRAAVQGGFAGLAGDLATKDYSKFGNVAESLAGPVVGGLLQDTAEIASRIPRGKLREKDVWKYGMKTIPSVIVSQ